MITFASLFLGLVLGVHGVELVAGESVAAVELRLDGEVVEVIESPPWSREVDFGLELLPRRLEAVALDAAGGTLGRAAQWINLPRDPAASRILLEGGPEERVARLTWESAAGAVPRQVRVSFDGRPLRVGDPRRIPLPPHDEARLHFLRVELEFSAHVRSVTEAIFGGGYGDRISTELTALPIVLEKGHKWPPMDEIADWLGKGGEPLEVMAVDKGPAEVVLVAGNGFRQALHLLRHRLPQGQRVPRSAATFGAGQRLRFLYPFAWKRQGVGASFGLFPMSPEFIAGDGGVYHLITEQRVRKGEERLADAVAVAGLSAAGHRRRRAVVLALGEKSEDVSQFTPTMARAYLAALRVPFYVWYPGRQPDPAAAAWGATADVSILSRLDAAVDRVARDLDRQRIVWIDGVHLPQDVELAAEATARGLRLAP